MNTKPQKLVFKETSLSKVDKFIQEIFWRIYWKGWLELRPKVWTDFVDDLKAFEEGPNYVKAINGETNINCFNDWVKELKILITFIIIRECYLQVFGFLLWAYLGKKVQNFL